MTTLTTSRPHGTPLAAQHLVLLALCAVAAGLALIVTQTPTPWDGRALGVLSLLWLHLGQLRMAPATRGPQGGAGRRPSGPHKGRRTPGTAGGEGRLGGCGLVIAAIAASAALMITLIGGAAVWAFG